MPELTYHGKQTHFPTPRKGHPRPYVPMVSRIKTGGAKENSFSRILCVPIREGDEGPPLLSSTKILTITDKRKENPSLLDRTLGVSWH